MLVYHISLNYGRITFREPEDGCSPFTFLSFFMATFYVASGYFFSTRKDIKSFLYGKWKSLIIPYLFFSLWGIVIFELYSLISGGNLAGLQIPNSLATASLRCNSPLWFLFSLFCCNVLYYCIQKYGGVILTHIFVVACIVLAFLTEGHRQVLSYGNILLGISFFHMGYYLKQYHEQLQKPIIGIFFLLFFILLGVFFPSRLEFVRNVLAQGNYTLNFIFTISGCYLIWILSHRWTHQNNIEQNIILLGRYSLVIFAFHRPVLNWIIEPLLKQVFPNISYTAFLIISLVCILSLGGGIYKFLNYCCPQVIGISK